MMAQDFPPRPSLDSLGQHPSRWRGPSPRSNWLVLGRLCCGDQPLTLDRRAAREALVQSEGARGCGVTTVVCLRTRAELQGRAGEYTAALRKLAPGLRWLHFPIADQSVTQVRLAPADLNRLLWQAE
jgi:hypothetical protein